MDSASQGLETRAVTSPASSVAKTQQVTEGQQGWPRSHSWARCGVDTEGSSDGDNQVPGSEANCSLQLAAAAVTAVCSVGQFYGL